MNNIQRNKKILLLSSNSFNLHLLIIKNLEYLGYEVIHIEDSNYKFEYYSVWERIHNFIRKLFFKNDFKTKFYNNFLKKKQLEILEQHSHFENALVIRADFFDIEFIKRVRDKVHNLFCFHFDGVRRDIKILNYVDYFDTFYVFDQQDLKLATNDKWKYSPNFYFDYPSLFKENNPIINYDVYYVSFYHKSRVDDVISIHKVLKHIFGNVKFIMFCPLDNLIYLPEYVNSEIEITQSAVSFEEQLAFISQSKVIIDLVISDHKGYSFRLLEGIKFRKKVITTNSNVIDADFYHPNNIFILTKDNYSQINDFLAIDYQELPKSIVLKYSFTEWINSKVIK